MKYLERERETYIQTERVRKRTKKEKEETIILYFLARLRQTEVLIQRLCACLQGYPVLPGHLGLICPSSIFFA